jgi:hypothetical protein
MSDIVRDSKKNGERTRAITVLAGMQGWNAPIEQRVAVGMDLSDDEINAQIKRIRQICNDK